MLRWEYDQEAEFRVLRQEAREEGIEQKTLEIAKNALKGGLTIQTISSITGLNEKAIRALA
jgi:predicted transposase/invertase (TIGR01784 family)